MGLGICLCTVLAWLGELDWRLDLFSSFRWQYAWMLALIAGLLAVVPRRHRPVWWLHAVITGFAVANFAVVLPAWWPRPTVPAEEGSRLRVLSLNVHTANTRIAEAEAAILAADADVVLLMEVNNAWVAGLSGLAKQYPHRLLAPQEDNFGMALYSRLPMTGDVETSVVGNGVPFVDVRLATPSGEIRFLGIHTLPPINREYAMARDSQLLEVVALLADEPGPVILAGDLNCTPWSPHFRRMLAKTGLRDSRNGFGMGASWPTLFPAPCRIPIDHVLHSAGLTVKARRLGPDGGSDHRPVICELICPAAVQTH
jgi:endonuclease/exonuclease/phosphatase (EEP) superfamily protein YafD